MKTRVTVFLSALLLASFNVAAKDDPVPAYDQAIADQRIASLAEAGLNDIDTLWIPERYRDDNKGALYLQGKRYTTPDGHSDVLGFLPMAGGGYLVAVYQEGVPVESADLPEHSGNAIVFYRSDETGQTQEQLGVIKPAGRVIVGKQGIFVARQSGTKKYSYTGYSAEGKPLAGPQDVYFATPSSDGGWLVEVQAKPKDVNGVKTAFYKVGADGNREKLRDGLYRENRYYKKMLNTTAAFVNVPPYADSVRTGFHMYLSLGGEVTGPGSRPWYGSFTSFELPDIEAKARGLLAFGRSYTKRGHYVVDYGMAQSIRPEVALDLGRRSALVGDKDRPLAITQLDSSDHRGGYVGFADLYAQEGKPQHSTPVFKIAGAGFELF
ncbi:MAG TPA: hypothetical protein VK972_01860, partial [Wenzhouxiangella sp.]|nr:hypothetical protein [Wenzhouxiangella sp.]